MFGVDEDAVEIKTKNAKDARVNEIPRDMFSLWHCHCHSKRHWTSGSLIHCPSTLSRSCYKVLFVYLSMITTPFFQCRIADPDFFFFKLIEFHRGLPPFFLCYLSYSAVKPIQSPKLIKVDSSLELKRKEEFSKSLNKYSFEISDYISWCCLLILLVKNLWLSRMAQNPNRY